MKAVLEAQEIIPPKTHDLIRLNEMVEVQLDIEEDILAQLNETYIESRYPLTVGYLPQGFPSVEEAKSFYEFAKAIHNRIIEVIDKQ